MIINPIIFKSDYVNEKFILQLKKLRLLEFQEDLNMYNLSNIGKTQLEYLSFINNTVLNPLEKKYSKFNLSILESNFSSLNILNKNIDEIISKIRKLQIIYEKEKNIEKSKLIEFNKLIKLEIDGLNIKFKSDLIKTQNIIENIQFLKRELHDLKLKDESPNYYINKDSIVSNQFEIIERIANQCVNLFAFLKDIEIK